MQCSRLILFSQSGARWFSVFSGTTSGVFADQESPRMLTRGILVDDASASLIFHHVGQMSPISQSSQFFLDRGQWRRPLAGRK